MSESIFLLDMDGILFDLHGKIIERWNTEAEAVTDDPDPKINRDSFKNNSPSKGLAHLGKVWADDPGHEIESKALIEYWLKEEGFYRELAVIEGAQAGVQAIVDIGLTPVVLSSYGNAPGCVPDKAAALAEHFPMINRRDYIFTSRKTIVEGTAYLDDGLEYLLEWQNNRELSDKASIPFTFQTPYLDSAKAKAADLIRPPAIFSGWDDLRQSLLAHNDSSPYNAVNETHYDRFYGITRPTTRKA